VKRDRWNGAIIAGGFAAGVVAVLLITWPARAEDPRKEYLHLQATEFCATVKKPPEAIAEALNNAVKQDPKTWMPAIVWWNAIAERYNELKCGDV
jgi:hypothetical protein